jgi:maltooligosyltrehalose trehalohydrolase
VETGGIGIDAQWCDDLHHALRTTFTGERGGYFADFRGFDDLAKAFRDGFVLDGGYCEFRGRRHGNSARGVEPKRFVVCSQNHDQVGNRASGERLTETLDFEQLKLAAATVILSPYQPLLFMGEEYAETAPFPFFISHLDGQLVDAVRRGRNREFESFRWRVAPRDPQDETTFASAKLNHDLKREGQHRVMLDFYRELIALRKRDPALSYPRRDRIEVTADEERRVLIVRRWTRDHETITVFHYGAAAVSLPVYFPVGAWTKSLDSADVRWRGPGATLADRVESSGTVELQLAPHDAVVLSRSG